ncbi:uncharacterized protein LOC108987109 [Juglans regia]|uniref:Uncharacterized protein LOC108987109 n=1 Tax=Juglans regia TaxID=51240 RepID=A0A2I4E7Z5_JUGRE|nr:uncharacterized protein LOC108987109 [Juglans regia]
MEALRSADGYALDVNVERAEDVLTHKTLLQLVEDPANRPAFDVWLVLKHQGVINYRNNCLMPLDDFLLSLHSQGQDLSSPWFNGQHLSSMILMLLEKWLIRPLKGSTQLNLSHGLLMSLHIASSWSLSFDHLCQKWFKRLFV